MGTFMFEFMDAFMVKFLSAFMGKGGSLDVS